MFLTTWMLIGLVTHVISLALMLNTPDIAEEINQKVNIWGHIKVACIAMVAGPLYAMTVIGMFVYFILFYNEDEGI